MNRDESLSRTTLPLRTYDTRSRDLAIIALDTMIRHEIITGFRAPLLRAQLASRAAIERVSTRELIESCFVSRRRRKLNERSSRLRPDGYPVSRPREETSIYFRRILLREERPTSSLACRTRTDSRHAGRLLLIRGKAAHHASKSAVIFVKSVILAVAVAHMCASPRGNSPPLCIRAIPRAFSQPFPFPTLSPYSSPSCRDLSIMPEQIFPQRNLGRAHTPERSFLASRHLTFNIFLIPRLDSGM